MADRQKMSVDEILAACRKADADGGAAEKSPAPAKEKPVKAEAVAESAAKSPVGEAPAAESPAVEEKPAPAPKEKPKAGAKTPGGMSVADMLAAARASAGGAKKEAPAVGAKSAPKPKAAPVEKAAPKASAVAAEKKSAGPRDTQSILAAARKVDKPGPITKAEAAAKASPVKEDAKKRLEVPPMPEKPAYAKPLPARARATDGDETRRGFLGIFLGSFLAIGFTSLGLTNLLYVLGFARFMFPNILTEPPTRFKVGPPANFAPGMVETKFVAQFNVWVVNTIYQGMPIIFALKTVCTHLGCTPNWLEAEQKFKCPCHGSGFYKDGVNFEGPAPRPLERHAIRVADDGQLEIDKSRIFQEEKGQWKDPNSFVPV